MTLKITKNHIPDAIDGIPHKEAGDLLASIVQAGSISADDELMEQSGISNHLRRASANLKATVDNLPVVLDRTLDQKLAGLGEQQALHQQAIAASCGDIKGAVDSLGNLIKKSPLSSGNKLPHGLDLKSIAIGSMATLLLSTPLFYFVVVPGQVRTDRGKDWAIAEWLNSPEGRKTRVIFQKHCQNKYPCKKLDKAQG
jgi:hypothetical protein